MTHKDIEAPGWSCGPDLLRQLITYIEELEKENEVPVELVMRIKYSHLQNYISLDGVQWNCPWCGIVHQSQAIFDLDNSWHHFDASGAKHKLLLADFVEAKNEC